MGFTQMAGMQDQLGHNNSPWHIHLQALRKQQFVQSMGFAWTLFHFQSL
jgi:hypothetical protein